MVLGSLLFWGSLLGARKARESYTIARNTNIALAKGHFDRMDCATHNRIYQDYLDDWKGERKKFSENDIPYLEKNRTALTKYIMSQTWMEEKRRGLLPYGIAVVVYDKRTFNPIADFYKMYGEKIKIFNETGRVYY